MLLYISGSFPDNQEGIASGAKVLLDAMLNIVSEENVILLTTDTPVVSEHIQDNTTVRYELLKNWKVTAKNIHKIEGILDRYPITAIHMEYPGDLYGKTFLASFLPFLVRRYNRKRGKQITYHVRLHEFTRARFLRKIAILPILWFADAIYVPAQKDREVVARFGGSKVHPTIIGTNIKVVSQELIRAEKVTVSYFGSVYPGKGIEQMLNIWKKINEQDSNNRFRFKIIGDIGTEKENHFAEYHAQVWKWIEQYGLKDSIEVTGYISDEDVSREIRKTQIATLFYEDGLTLRRGSFLAYLAHGIPIVTSMGDQEAKALFDGHEGIAMGDTDEEFVRKIMEFADLTEKKREEIHKDNIALSERFDWNEIAGDFLTNYGIV